MRYFTQIQTIAPTPAAIARARFFAERVMATFPQGYGDTGQHNLAKIQADHGVSKIGEACVAAVFRRCGQPVTGPDYEIYAGNQKSWDADLTVAGVPLAVKTQTQAAAQQYERSWTFQASPQRFDPILQEPAAWVCFVVWDEKAAIAAVYPPYQIRELVFAEPKRAALQGTKRVVYAHTLPHLG